MAREEAVVLGVEVHDVLRHAVRHDRLGVLEARAVAAPEHLVRHHELVAAELRIGGELLRVDVDEFHDPIGVAARGGREQMRDDVAPHHDVCSQRLRFPAQHVRSTLREALVLQQPRVPPRSLRVVGRLDGAVPVRDRVSRVRHVAVEGGACPLARALEGQSPGGTEVQVARAAGGRRPRVAPHPAVGAGFEGKRLWQVHGLVLQVVREKSRLHAVAEILPRIHAEADVAELVDRKSTRLNSSHSQISYAVFCLKKKKKKENSYKFRSYSPKYVYVKY